MLFSIVIPAYNCGSTLHLPLASLTTQMFKDFEVIIVDDGSNEDEKEKVKTIMANFSDLINVRMIYNPCNSGCGITRQNGMSESQGDYVIFMDSDDMLATAESLMHFARLIQANNYPDVVSTGFMEYDGDTGRMTPMSENNNAFVHGKAYRLDYIRDNDIKFPSQKWFEDGAFNFLAINMTNKVVRDHEVTYMWTHNPNSITRSRDYNFEVMPYYVQAYVEAFPKLKAQDEKKAYYFMNGILAFGYYYWNAFKKRNVDSVKLDEFIVLLRKAFKDSGLIEYMNGHRDVFDVLCQGDSTSKGNIESQEGHFVPLMSLNEWLKKYFNCSIVWLEV